MHEGLVMKRVNAPLSSQKGDQAFAAGPEYRLQLRTLGLEVLALSNPTLRQHPNITVTGAKPSYVDRLLSYLTDAATGGYSSARAIYGQVTAAHGHRQEVDSTVLKEWMYQAVSEGYILATQSTLTIQRLEQTLNVLRDNGGFCNDPFLKTPKVIEATRSSEKALQLEYKAEYIPTLRRIVFGIPVIDIRNEFEQETPLHTLAATYHPEDEFEEACEILLAHGPPADINAQTRRGTTPLYIALTTDDPTRRGLILLSKGSSPLLLTDQKRDVFYSLTNNTALTDKKTHDLIIASLEHARTTCTDIPQQKKDSIHTIYQHLFLPNPGAVQTLFASIARGKLETMTLLLSLGLQSRINDINPDRVQPFKPLDQALHSAELTRREHIEKLALYEPGPGRRAAIEASLVYNDAQGPPARAAEAYHAFPEILLYLRNQGARRRCEVEWDENVQDPASSQPDSQNLNTHPEMDGTYTAQPQFWEWGAIYTYGFTPSTQPHRQKWQIIYDLARHPRNWLEEQIDELGSMYEMDGWRPDVRFFEEADQGVVGRVVRKIGDIVRSKNRNGGVDVDGSEEKMEGVRLFAIDPKIGHVEVVVVDGRIVEKRKITFETTMGI
ncbi:hypothetical protein BDV06DRAFT_225137 [Aspergillus oleicola]